MNFLINPFLIMSLLASSFSAARTIADAHVEYTSGLPLALLLVTVGMPFQSVEERAERTKEEMERDAKATIKRLLSEFGSQLKADSAKAVAANLRARTAASMTFQGKTAKKFNS